MTQVSINISKISYFSSSSKLNEREKVLLKNMVWTGGLEKKFYWTKGLIFNRGTGNISKKDGNWQESGGEKIGG